MKKVSEINSLKINRDSFEEMMTNHILKDKYIIKFLEKYQLSKEIIKKNEQVFYEYYLSKKNSKKIEYKPKLKFENQNIYLVFEESEKQKKLRQEKLLSNRIKTAYISKNILNSNFSNLTQNKNKLLLATELIEIADKKLAHLPTRGLYIYGKTGIGKSYLVASLYNYLKSKGKEPAIIYFPEFVRKMKSKITSGDYTDIIDELRAQEILIIDDIGAENISEFVRDEILVPIINYRSTENLLTFFTSNLSIADLGDFLSTTKNTIDETKALRIIDRIRHLANQVYLDSENERL